MNRRARKCKKSFGSCVVCGKEIPLTYEGAAAIVRMRKYCSARCSNKASYRRKNDLTVTNSAKYCIRCGAEIVGRYHLAKYCSKSCKVKQREEIIKSSGLRQIKRHRARLIGTYGKSPASEFVDALYTFKKEVRNAESQFGY